MHYRAAGGSPRLIEAGLKLQTLRGWDLHVVYNRKFFSRPHLVTFDLRERFMVTKIYERGCDVSI